MDKSRDIGARPEVQARLDAMKQGGWAVGRTWGFSLGTGLVNSPVGQVVADPTKILEIAPGASVVLCCRQIALQLILIHFRGFARAADLVAHGDPTVQHFAPKDEVNMQACTMRRYSHRWTGSWTRLPSEASTSSCPSRCSF